MLIIFQEYVELNVQLIIILIIQLDIVLVYALKYQPFLRF